MLNDPAAERATLAGIIKFGGTAYCDVADILSDKTFSMESNAVIYRCLERCLKDNPNGQIDLASILSAANGLGIGNFFHASAERDHLRGIINFPIKLENTRKFAATIRKLEVARLLNIQLEEARNNLSQVTGTESIDQILAMAEAPIFDFTTLLAGTDNRQTKLMGEGAEEYLTHLMDNPRDTVGISTGLRRFDMAIGGGLRANSMDIISARPKVGKTQLVDNIGTYVAGQNIPAFNVDTEMSQEEHLHRVAANLAGVPVRDIELGKCGKSQHSRRKVLDAAKKLRDMPYYYRCITGEAFEETLANIRRWIVKDVGLEANGKAKPCVIIFDYLKLMSADNMKSMQEFQMLGFIATALKNLASRYGVPILTFAQLNRDGIDKEDTSAISQSDRIIWFCTSFTIYKWKTPEERAEATGDARKYTHKLVPIISRSGKGLQDGDYINVFANYEMGRIEEGPLKSEAILSSPAANQGFIINAEAAATSF